ncbi:MAG TPA: phosphatase PAP2 family protein [Steroidobacteraceae bacterium]
MLISTPRRAGPSAGLGRFDPMNAFDRDILLFLNRYADRWHDLDVLLNQFQENNLLKGAVFFATIWYLWFRPARSDRETLEVHQKLFATICALTVGIIVARTLADLLPFRVRPAFDPELHLQIPPALKSNNLMTWSSFPSDHAVVWFTLAFGIMTIDRKLGVLGCVYAFFLGLGRVYAGVHYPTDILAAAAIAAGVTWLFHREVVRTALYNPAARLHLGHPGIFYAGAFLLTYEIANLFDQVRDLGTIAWNFLHRPGISD